MSYAELARKLRALGCEMKRQSKGGHEIWHNPNTNCSTVVPAHSGEIAKGTLHAILRQLGIDRNDFRR